jgi:capsular polysaccharide transport system permease protein
MTGDVSLTQKITAQGRLLVALMLRDIKTRFGGTELGFLFAIVWPLTHIMIQIVINAAVGRAVPFGDSPALWSATGVIPFIAFSYMSRFLMFGMVMNKPLLSFPIVKTTDLLFARAIVEVLSAAIVVIVTLLIFSVVGIDCMPRDIVQAFLAMLAMMFLGLGFGVINGIIAAAVPFWLTGYSLLIVVFWLTSGVYIIPDALPEVARVALSYLPYVQGVEWMRSAYYDSYGAGILDKSYMLSFAAITLFAGLAIERLVRGRVLMM